MGSKQLKAMVALGHQSISCHDSKGLMELLNLHLTKLFQSPVAQNRMKYGTPSTLDVTNAAGMLPTHNFKVGIMTKDTLDNEGVYKNIVKSRGCYDCQIAWNNRRQKAVLEESQLKDRNMNIRSFWTKYRK